MKQYTTPVIQWIFKYINLSTVEQIRVIIKDEANNMVEITDPEIHGNVVQVKLTRIIDDFGTEEFVSTGIVPVGHNTRYPANLRDKLQHLPSLASADGTYLIQQSGKQMSLIHMPTVFPDTPTEDGTYTLKTVVTGGTPTLQWVAE